jgi:hypothetical protein
VRRQAEVADTVTRDAGWAGDRFVEQTAQLVGNE